MEVKNGWKCKEDCGECCGTITLNPEIVFKNIGKIQRKITKTIPIGRDEDIYETEDGLCLFLTPDKECAIYQDRPEVCRLYGINPKLPCPYIKPNGNPRSPAKIKRTQRQIDHNINDTLKRMKRFVEEK